jgi:hypothetical protein
MNHRLTRRLLAIVTIVMLVATMAFALAVTAGRSAVPGAPAARAVIPSIVHPTSQRMTECTRCHTAGSDRAPRNHTTYALSTCLTCHRVAETRPERPARQTEPGTPPTLPHPSVKPYDECTGCHAIGGNLGMPQDHADFTIDTCTTCHES